MQASVTTFKTLKPCLESATNNQDEVVCGIQNTGAGYSFTSFATQESFVNYLLSGAPDSKFANELLCGPTLSFFDFDAKCSLEELQWQTIKALVGFLTDFLQKSYKKYLNVTLKKKVSSGPTAHAQTKLVCTASSSTQTFFGVPRDGVNSSTLFSNSAKTP